MIHLVTERILSTSEEIKIMSDPLRLTIYKTFHKLGRPSTAKEVADELGLAPAKVHYHVQKMLSIGILELDHTKEINGIIAKFFKVTADSFIIDYSNISDKVKNSVYSKSENLYLSIFNDFRDKFLNSLRNKVKNNSNSNADRSGFIMHDKMYIKQGEYEKFYDELVGLIEKYGNQDEDEENIMTYNFLISMIKKEEEEK